MSVSVPFNGVTYTLPNGQETDWGTQLTAFLQAVGSSSLAKSGGVFTLTADADFGATYGLKSNYFTSRASNAATAGVLRLARADAVKWRNQANGADLTLGVDSSNNLEWESVDLVTVSATQTLTNKTLTTPTITDTAWIALTLLNSWVDFGTYGTPAYRKLANGDVQLRGAVKDGSSASAVIATLPAGYRPPAQCVRISNANGAACFLIIGANGNINAVTGGSTTETTLDGVVIPTVA